MNDSASSSADPAPTVSEPVANRRLLSRRYVRYPLFALAAYLAVCGISALAIPLLVEQVAFAKASDAIGRKVTAERMRFNPFTLTLTLQGLHVDGIAPQTEFIDIDEVRADLSIASVRYLAPVIEALKISSPRIRLQRIGERRFDFSDIVDRLSARPAGPDDSDAAPVRFAVHDVELTDGKIVLDDQFLKQQHQIRNLRIAVPFISNLDYASETEVHPTLSALINDSPLTVTAKSLPFSATRDTSVDIDLASVDIATYLPLSPVPLGFKVPKGRLGTDLNVAFSQDDGANRLEISGEVRVDDLQIDTRGAGRLVTVPHIALQLEKLEPLVARYAFGDLTVTGLDMTIERDAAGDLPLVQAFTVEPRPHDAAKTRSTSATRPAPGEAQAPATPGKVASASLRWSLHGSRLKGGRIVFIDRAVSPTVELVHSDIALKLGAIGNRQLEPAAASLSLTQGERSKLSWEGTLNVAKSHAAGQLAATVAEIAPYLPYLDAAFASGTHLETGDLSAQGSITLDWAKQFALELTDATASVRKAGLTLPNGTQAALAFEQLAVEGAAVSLGARSATVSRLLLAGVDARLERDAQGQLNLPRALAAAQPAANTATAVTTTTSSTTDGKPPASPAAPWQVEIERIDLERNQVDWHDLTSPSPVNVPFTSITGHIEQVGTDLSQPSRVDLKAQVGQNGSVAARGDVKLAPWSAQLTVELLRLPLPSIDPYVADYLTLGIEAGELTTSGQIGVDAEHVRYQGRLEVDDLSTRERLTSANAIRWKSLLLDEIDLDLTPATLDPEDRIAIGKITLSDFFARVLLTEQGRLNLQDLVRTEASIQAQARAEETRQLKAAGSDEVRTTESDEGAPPQKPTERTLQSTALAPAVPQAGPTIRLGPIQLERGRSNFTDRFIRPNYSVNLTDLQGGLSALASDNPEPAEFRLAGRIDGDAPIDITGRINPLAVTLFVDVRAEAKGIDLPTFSPYSGKYIGYDIEKGKLSLDVHYRIADEKLEAQNRLVLDKLTLGEKVSSPNATSLPIQFALGLLKDRNGEIDLNLPISGSLDDPQFSIGDIIGKAIVNLLTRIITSPFTALASAVGGDEELSFVEFEPGTAQLAKDAVERLTTLAKALQQRPALELEIAGRVDPKTERDAMARQRLDAQLRALKRREASGAAAVEGARVTVSPEEYPALLRQLYESTEWPAKPADAKAEAKAGAKAEVKSPEVPEMEKRLLEAIDVDAEAFRRLALRRARVARDWLVTQGKVASERIFTLAPRTSAKPTASGQSKSSCQAHCAEFSLR